MSWIFDSQFSPLSFHYPCERQVRHNEGFVPKKVLLSMRGVYVWVALTKLPLSWTYILLAIHISWQGRLCLGMSWICDLQFIPLSFHYPCEQVRHNEGFVPKKVLLLAIHIPWHCLSIFPVKGRLGTTRGLCLKRFCCLCTFFYF